MKKPNIILIYTDQQRGDCLGADGHPVVQTPYLDELAANGVRFDRGYSAVPSCIPARAILMTGQNAWHAGILGMGEGQCKMPSDYPVTMPGELAKAGYHTGLVGKMHFNPLRALNGFHNTILDEHDGPNHSGFMSDYALWFEENKPANTLQMEHGLGWNTMIARPFHLPEYYHPTNWTMRESIKWLKRRDPDKPFFLCTSFIRPHSPYDPPQVYWDMYADKDIPEPMSAEWDSIHDREEDPAQISSYGKSSTSPYRGKRGDEETRRARIGYYASVTHIDHQIGYLLENLKRNGLYDETLIIFSSDHGDMLGDHNLWRKTYPYESSIRIPYLVKFPKSAGIKPGQVCSAPVELMDIMPTMLEAAGIPIPELVDGESLYKLAHGKTDDWRRYLHGEHCKCYDEELEHQYLTDGKYKYIWFPRTNKEQFFDLVNDPDETHDLVNSDKHSSTVNEFKRELMRLMDERNLGLVKNGDFVKQTQSMVSPYRDKRRTEL